METGPSPLIEAIVEVLIPAAYREHVMGDLNERYTSPLQYVAEAIRTVPFVLWSHIRRSFDLRFNDRPLGGKLMTLSAQDRERLREEESVRLEVRNEQRRKQRPRLLAVAILWTLALTALAFGSNYLHS